MITAMQGSKIRTAMKLMEAKDIIRDHLSQICLGRTERDHLYEALQHLDKVLDVIAPSNDEPPPMDMMRTFR